MEYFDVVDKNRVQLNYKKIRGEKLEKNEFNTGVEMWIINNNKILMTQRSEQKSHPGQWETPGGCSQAGESIIDTIKREMIEEIGVNFNQDEFCLIGTHLYKKQFVDIFLSEKEIDINKVILQKEEVQNIKWISKDEFNNLIKNGATVPSVLQRFNMIKDKLKIDW